MNIFGGNTGVSYEDIKRQRAVAERLIAAQTRNGPRNVGEGLTAIGNALAARSLSKKAEAKSAELDAQWAESAGGMGIDPARMEIIKNLPYDQRQAYMLRYMDQQDALRRRGSGGSGTAKADAQAALVAQLLGGGAGQPASPAQPAVSGFDMAQDITGQAPMQMPDFSPGAPVEQTPMLDQKGMTPTQTDFNNELIAQYAQPAAPVAPPVAPPAPVDAGMTGMTAPLGQGDIGDLEQYLAQTPAPVAQPAPAPAMPADISAPLTPIGQPEQGLSFNLPDAAPSPVDAQNQGASGNNDPYADQRDALTSDINRLYDMLSNPSINAQTKKAVLDAVKIKDAQLKRLPDAPSAPKPTQDGVMYVPDGAGGFRAEYIPGSPADIERQAALSQMQTAQESALKNEQTRQSVVLDTAKDIRKSLETGGLFDLPEVGVIGSKLGWINQEAANVQNQLTTLKGMVVFDRLEKLKQASKTGASGLGQVTEKEIDLLGAQLGTLDASSGEDVILKTIKTIEDVFGKLSPEAEAYLTGKSDTLPPPSTKGPVMSDADYLKSLGLE